MKDIIDILCWFVNLLRGFFEAFGIDPKILDDITGALQGLNKK